MRSNILLPSIWGATALATVVAPPNTLSLLEQQKDTTNHNNSEARSCAQEIVHRGQRCDRLQRH